MVLGIVGLLHKGLNVIGQRAVGIVMKNLDRHATRAQEPHQIKGVLAGGVTSTHVGDEKVESTQFHKWA
jgi:hypothetical protein